MTPRLASFSALGSVVEEFGIEEAQPKLCRHAFRLYEFHLILWTALWPLSVPDLTAEHIQALRELPPEVFSAGKIDFKKLRAAQGNLVDPLTPAWRMAFLISSQFSQPLEPR